MRERGGTQMKKLSIPKLKFKKQKKDDTPGRITNETVAEHRERVIAGGRRFKYPLQYAKHKLVINAVVISITAIILLVMFGWWQLYVVQNTSTFFYRVTQVLSLPVGSIEGKAIRYSDYLLYYRPSEYYLNNYDEVNADSADGRTQLEYKKRDAMDRAMLDAYARKLAKDMDITVSEDEVDDAVAALQQADNGTISEESVNSAALQVFGATAQDTRAQYRNSLLRSKVSFAVDDDARALADRVKTMLDDNKSLKDVAAIINKEQKGAVEYGTSGLMSKSLAFSGVKVSEIAAVKKGTVSDAFMSSTDDGYLFTRVTSTTNTEANFEFVHVPLTAFRATVQALHDSDDVREYITIDPDRYL